MSFGPPIETLDNWNVRLAACGCCEMPSCPTLTARYKSATATYSPAGFATPTPGGPESNGWPLNSTRTTTYSATIDVENAETNACGTYNYFEVHGSSTGDDAVSYDQNYNVAWTVAGFDSSATASVDSTLSGSWNKIQRQCSGGTIVEYWPGEKLSLGIVSDDVITSTWNIRHFGEESGGPFDVTNTYTTGGAVGELGGPLDSTTVDYSGPTTRAAWIAACYAHHTAAVDAVLPAITTYTTGTALDIMGPAIEARTTHPPTAPLVGQIATFRTTWLYFRVPTDHLGSYFKVTFDIVFFPDGYNFGNPADPGNPAPTVLLEDQTLEWAGPGDPEDIESWLFPAYKIPAPADDGRSRVRNIRFSCYRGDKFGARPQTQGLAFP
jgi:hypothetical protein